MSHDTASGVISFENKADNIDITWEKVGFEKSFKNVNQALEKKARGLGGTFVKNPTWVESLGRSVISAHPLGGCPMGESGRNAVVNHAGQVFDGKILPCPCLSHCCNQSINLYLYSLIILALNKKIIKLNLIIYGKLGVLAAWNNHKGWRSQAAS